MPEEPFKNCKFRERKQFKNKEGKIIVWGKCRKDGKSCREWDMIGYDCYTIRDKDILPQFRAN